MQVYLANYNVPNDNNAAYNRQKQVIQDVITTYGTGNIDGVTVGNEYMLKYGPRNCTQRPFGLLLSSATSFKMEVAKQTVLLVIKAQHFLSPTLKTPGHC
jgi:hypothetical protein